MTTVVSAPKISSNPLVSVIIPVYNRGVIVGATLNSLVLQTYRPLEIILINDGSTDNTYEVLSKWSLSHKKADLSIALLTQANKGAPAARNKGIEYSSGVYLQFLDSDDSLEPVKIERQVLALEKTGADVAVCDFRRIFENGNDGIDSLNDGFLPLRLALGWSIYTSTPLIRSSLVGRKIRWCEQLRRNQDMDFLFKVVLSAPSCIYTPGVWCNYIMHSGPQISDTYDQAPPQNLRRIASLLQFLFLVKNISWRRKVFAMIGIGHLVKNSFRFWLKILMLRFLGARPVALVLGRSRFKV